MISIIKSLISTTKTKKFVKKFDTVNIDKRFVYWRHLPTSKSSEIKFPNTLKVTVILGLTPYSGDKKWGVPIKYL